MTGKTKRKKIIGSSQTEVSNKGKAFPKLIDDGILPDANEITVWSWLDMWLNDYIKPNVRTKTYEKYESSLRCYIKPTLGNVIITKIKSLELKRVFNELLVNGGTKNNGISTSTIRFVRRCLYMAFKKGRLSEEQYIRWSYVRFVPGAPVKSSLCSNAEAFVM